MFEPNQIKRYFVVVVGRQKGRFFTIHNSSIETIGEEVIDDVHQKIKSEGSKAGKIDNEIRGQLHHHLKNVGNKTQYFLNKHKKHIDGVIVGGHKELIHEIEKYLPTQLKRSVIGEFVTDVDLPVKQLLEESKKVLLTA
jgi:peptide subunit release factor 1 (eRF1)